MIHGDIKPQNVLVFKNADDTTVKVADFGYSTLTAGETGTVHLPKSRPWNAPECQLGKLFNVPEAKKADVYSFGLLCLWVLFGNTHSGVSVTTSGSNIELLSFDGPPAPHVRTLLEELKDKDRMEDIAHQLIQTISDLSVEDGARLREFFRLAVAHDPRNRSSDLGKLVVLLSPQRSVCKYCDTQRFANDSRTGLQSPSMGPREAPVLQCLSNSTHEDFRVNTNLLHYCLEDIADPLHLSWPKIFLILWKPTTACEHILESVLKRTIQETKLRILHSRLLFATTLGLESSRMKLSAIYG